MWTAEMEMVLIVTPMRSIHGVDIVTVNGLFLVSATAGVIIVYVELCEEEHNTHCDM
jgi:hypothetical protein